MKIRKEIIFLIIGLVPSIFLYIYFFTQKKLPLSPEVSNDPFVSLPENFSLPNLVLDNQRIGIGEEINVDSGSGLKVISGLVIPILEQEQQQQAMVADPEASDSADQDEVSFTDQKKKLAGVRIIGEVKNISSDTISAGRPVVNFYDQEKKLVATKIGSWTEGYNFLPLEPGEVNIYDFLVPNPPESETVSIDIRPEEGKPDSEQIDLKVKERSLTEETLEKDGQTVKYFKLTAQLINPTNQSVVNPGVYLWLKNVENKVAGISYHIFEADLLEPGKELKVDLLIVPFSSEEGKAFEYEVKAFGKSL